MSKQFPMVQKLLDEQVAAYNQATEDWLRENPAPAKRPDFASPAEEAQCIRQFLDGERKKRSSAMQDWLQRNPPPAKKKEYADFANEAQWTFESQHDKQNRALEDKAWALKDWCSRRRLMEAETGSRLSKDGHLKLADNGVFPLPRKMAEYHAFRDIMIRLSNGRAKAEMEVRSGEDNTEAAVKRLIQANHEEAQKHWQEIKTGPGMQRPARPSLLSRTLRRLAGKPAEPQNSPATTATRRTTPSPVIPGAPGRTRRNPERPVVPQARETSHGI